MSDPRQELPPLLQTTPFHLRTASLNKRHEWLAWAGYSAPASFGDVTAEYTAIRNAASLYDLCPMVKYEIAGRDSEACLNRLMLRDVRKLRPGRVHYTAWCDADGKVLDDGTLFRLSETRFRLCCQERHLPWLTDAAMGFDVEIREITEAIAALSLQGPTSYAVLLAAGFGAARNLAPFAFADYSSQGLSLTISRTGFTGDLGYELWTTPDRALELWDLLMEKGAPHGLRPIGSAALDMARIEAGFIITNLDFVAAGLALRPDRRRSPLELGLGWMIDFDKGHFNGRRALMAEKARGSGWSLVGLDIEGNIPATHSLIYHGKEKEVGHVTAALWSPAAKRNIALAMLRRPYDAARSQNLWAEIYALRELEYTKLMVRARIVPRPFFAPSRRKANPPALN